MIFFSHVIINFAVAPGGGGEESRKNYFIKIICSYHKKAVPLRFK